LRGEGRCLGDFTAREMEGRWNGIRCVELDLELDLDL
jgi:hypothetical protein